MKALFTTLLILLTTIGTLWSQPRANFPMLYRMNQAPSTFMNQVFFPTESELTETVFLFKIGYSQLTFLRDQTQNGDNYTSDVELIIDIYDEETAEEYIVVQQPLLLHQQQIKLKLIVGVGAAAARPPAAVVVVVDT